MQTLERTLEEESLWYKYKTCTWNTGTPEATTVHNIMRTLRAIRGQGELAYTSVPITSGRVLYELKSAKPDALGLELINRAIHENYLMGWGFIESLTNRLDCPVIYPADLVPAHQEWEQVHFQALWLSIIAEKCTQLHMADGWEFSNGGCEEFTHAMQLRLGLPSHDRLIFFNTKEKESAERARMQSIAIYDHLGNPLTIEAGIEQIKASLSWIVGRHFTAPKIAHCLSLLKATQLRLEAGFYQ
jgi:hypothetical protein